MDLSVYSLTSGDTANVKINVFLNKWDLLFLQKEQIKEHQVMTPFCYVYLPLAKNSFTHIYTKKIFYPHNICGNENKSNK